MAAPQPPVDALYSFTYLTEQIPTWQTQLSALTTYASQKNADFISEYTKLITKIRPKRIKSPSLHSIHSSTTSHHNKSTTLPQISEAINDTTLPLPPNPSSINPLSPDNKYLYAQQAQRKRKPTSSVRSGASGPQKFRSRNQVVIYYDSHVQTELDSMVKAIGLARNNLRKGRNAHKAASGFMLPPLGGIRHELSTAQSIDSLNLKPAFTPVVVRGNLKGARAGEGASTPPTSLSKHNLRSSPQVASSTSSQPATSEEGLFVATDKTLETIQSLYETAAHQFLRDGDCSTELTSALSRLKEVQESVKVAAEVFRRLKEEDGEFGDDMKQDTVTVKDDLSKSATTNGKLNPASAPQIKSHTPIPVFSSPPSAPKSNLSAPPLGPPIGAMEIEVDDQSDSESLDEIDISQFRNLRSRGVNAY